MKNFSRKDIVEYLQKNFTTVDGLWFVKIEEILGFERALEIDKEVWKVLPKIQARFIKTKLQIETGKKLDNRQGLTHFGTEEFFIEALRIKMRLDNFQFRLLKKPGLVKIIINQCPWHDIMLKSKREHLSGKIGSAICGTEYEVFASEFLKNTSFKIKSRICNSATTCVFEFSTI
jgi:hypothetical protein